MSKTWRSLGLTFAIGALTAAVAHAQTPAPTTPGASTTPAAPAGSVDGQALLQADCTSCHDLGPVNAHGRSPQEWSDLVDRMVTYGASGSDSDLAAIKDYLAKTLPPSDAAPPAPPQAGPASNTK
jgi:hypothetical protein